MGSPKYGCSKDPRLSGLVPCALRGHCLWDTAIGRQLSGRELMSVHGFCLQPGAAQLQNKIITQLAGDTISVPTIGCMLALALANTAPSQRHVQVATHSQVDHHVPACWIGQSCWHGHNRTKDNLMELAGQSDKKKKKKAPTARMSSTKRRESQRAKKKNVPLDQVISLD